MTSSFRATIGVFARGVLVALPLAAIAPASGQHRENAAAPSADAEVGYSRATSGTRWLEGPGVAIKVLVETSNFGSAEAEVAELTLEPGSSGAEHRHGSHEIIVLLEGVLDHVVNGETHRLEPGMVGIVRRGDTVAHKVVSATPVKAILVWAPGGEADRLAALFRTKPVEAPPASP